MFRLRAPVDPAVTPDVVGRAVDFPGRLVVQKAIRFLAEDILADDPASVVGVGGKVGVPAGEKVLMPDHIAILEAGQFFGQRLGGIAC